MSLQGSWWFWYFESVYVIEMWLMSLIFLPNSLYCKLVHIFFFDLFRADWLLLFVKIRTIRRLILKLPVTDQRPFALIPRLRSSSAAYKSIWWTIFSIRSCSKVSSDFPILFPENESQRSHSSRSRRLRLVRTLHQYRPVILPVLTFVLYFPLKYQLIIVYLFLHLWHYNLSVTIWKHIV